MIKQTIRYFISLITAASFSLLLFGLYVSAEKPQIENQSAWMNSDGTPMSAEKIKKIKQAEKFRAKHPDAYSSSDNNEGTSQAKLYAAALIIRCSQMSNTELNRNSKLCNNAVLMGKVFNLNRHTPSKSSFNALLYPRVDIDAFCKQKWTKKGLTDWRMVRYCVGNQEDAEAEASSMDVSDNMRRICINRWSKNWQMYRYCLEQQKKAYDSLLPSL